MTNELTMRLSGHGLILIYGGDIYYSPGNRCIHALGNPWNGIGISGTRLPHLT